MSDTSSREFGTIWKYVQITGNSRSIDKAKKLLQLRLDRLETSHADTRKPSYKAVTSDTTMVMVSDITVTEVAEIEVDEQDS